MKLKRANFWLALSGAAALLCGAAAAKAQESAERTYDAVATPLISTTLKFGYNDAFRGIITYVAPPGSIVKGTMYGLEGDIVEPGDILVHMETDYRQSLVEEKQANLKSAQANLKNALENYERYKKLIVTDATSLQLYQQNEAAYLAAIGNKEAAEADLELAVIMRDACAVRAPFDAIVDKVFFPAGLCAGELDVVRISQLSPMGVAVKMDRASALKISAGTPIVVHPCGADKPVGVLRGFCQLTEDGVILQVVNRLLPSPEETMEGGVWIPVCDFSEAMPVYSANGRELEWIWIPSDALLSDSKGVYVWRGVGQRDMRLGKGMDASFPVEKVYVSGSCKLPPEIRSKRMAVRNGGELKAFDVVLAGRIPSSLKDGDKVCARKPRYLFMPGDPIKVAIGKR